MALLAQSTSGTSATKKMSDGDHGRHPAVRTCLHISSLDSPHLGHVCTRAQGHRHDNYAVGVARARRMGRHRCQGRKPVQVSWSFARRRSMPDQLPPNNTHPWYFVLVISPHPQTGPQRSTQHVQFHLCGWGQGARVQRRRFLRGQHSVFVVF
jgi:hypothetical protein